MADIYSPEVTLDRSSDTPLYEQIAAPIEEAILSGEAPSGTFIEDEVSMAARLQVARPTARRALQELTIKGLVTRRRGVGTKVNPRYVHRAMTLSSLHEDLLQSGFAPSTRVLKYEVREATQPEAEQLEISIGEGVLSLSRLRYADNHPLALMYNLIPLDAAPSWNDLNEYGLYQCLRSQQIVVAAAVQEIGAREATSEEAELLHETPSAPLLTMRRIGRTGEGKIVEVGDHLYRPKLYSFRFSLFEP